ncbi:G2/mitotic-specific cyclin S13-7-like isoform X2 [Arachis ipaensis]|uniref:G2/mitotic-specific cyclin S13-7-like isoform X2 n=1 Tax=Arachis ipaensis TaxID=130454 RepID=UPI000A2B5A19|nr:G2/mitotic-specific cyclin S13-7-like isoform X2 [Arachis ipaensis]XP_025671856.1 G2/mitotic-specific cyclin S13-7 isoform X2 [Arachis hypogaea]
MENNRTTGKGKGKAKTEERGLGNRQVLGDISNLEVLKTTDGNHISRPITRKLYAKLLANSQSTANLLLDPKAQSNEGGAAQGNKAAREVLSKPDGQHVDIDADNGNIDLAVAEYLDDLYIFYKLTEDESRISDYMNSQNEINEKMRSITVDWLIDVHWRFNLMPETIYLTINIIDRYLSLTVIPKAELQLVGICSLLLACKYEEIVTPKVKVFAKLTDDAYTNQQILDMENAILEKLEWYLTVPTPYMFLDRFIRVPEQPDVELKNMVFFLAELGLMHYQIVLHCPSLIAAATVFAARYTLNRNPFWTEILKLRTGYVAEQIMECSKMLIRFQSSAADSKLDTVIQKFSSPERGAVALLPPLDPKHQVNNLT